MVAGKVQDVLPCWRWRKLCSAEVGSGLPAVASY